MTVDAAELAFHAARVAFAGNALVSGLPVRLREVRSGTPEDVIRILALEPKPLRITGVIEGSELTLRLGSVFGDPDTRRRYQLEHAAISRAIPAIADTDPEGDTILVVAFDSWLRVTAGTWGLFMRDFWIDGPLAWSSNSATSESAASLRLPQSALEGAAVVVLLGYSSDNGFQYPFLPRAWEASR